MQDSKIQWTDHTFNPWRGCTKIAAGCANCYADAQSKRNPGTLGIWGPNGTRVVAAESYWREPLKWQREAAESGVIRRVFCASLADVFEEWRGDVIDNKGRQLFDDGDGWFAPDKDSFAMSAAVNLDHVRRRLFKLIDATPNLDWLLVTKRPENIRRMWPFATDHFDNIPSPRLERSNVWLLTSVSDQETADRNIPELLKCRDLAPVLGLSYEPALGPVDFGSHAPGWLGSHQCGIDWIIVGGESGPHARPFQIEWARRTILATGQADVACFVKQLGSNAFQGDERFRTRDSKGGEPDEWPEGLRVREFPETAAKCG